MMALWFEKKLECVWLMLRMRSSIGSSSRSAHSTHHRPAFLSSAFAFLLLFVPLAHAAAETEVANPENGDPSPWQVLGAPYVTADPDFGVIIGAGAGIARVPHLSLILNGAVSTGGLAGGTVRGELERRTVRYLFTNRFWNNPENLYPSQGALPDAFAEAMVQRAEFQLAALFQLGNNLELGPEIWTLFAKGVDPETPAGNPLEIAHLPRYQRGELVLGGLRGRYRTTSAVRPMDGVVLDLALRAGRADGTTLPGPQATVAADLWAAIAKPLAPRWKLYLRGWARYQDTAPPSVRNPLGGLLTLRGQPFARDYGRRMLAGRFQLHYTAAQEVRFIGEWAHALIPVIPPLVLQAELAPFADVGAVADPDPGGWERTRQGYGISLRLVLPPELVFFFDLAYAPGADTPLLYFGGGETL